jgi:hypothetical protein
MDEITARELLEDMVSPSSIPILTDNEVDRLLNYAKRADVNGYLPSETEWEPTWNLAAAAARGWIIKAGKVAGLFPFSTDGQSYQRDQMHRMCIETANEWRRGAIHSIRAQTGLGFLPDATDILSNVNDG